MAKNNAEQWYPVACSEDLVPRHVFHGELNNVELALWRDDDNCVNAWENRCCHRSTRLSLGINSGRRLRCQYHGWQYRSGDGQCIIVPAASQTPPPASVCARTFAVAESNGLIWVNLFELTGTPLARSSHWLIDDAASGRSQHPLRSFVFHADAEKVAHILRRYPEFDQQMNGLGVSERSTVCALSLSWTTQAGTQQRLYFLLQPACTYKTIVHTVLETNADNEDGLSAWYVRHHSTMVKLRHQVVSEGLVDDVPIRHESFVPPPPKPQEARSRARMLYARITHRYETTDDILALEVEPENESDIGGLADFIPGAHIDVTTPSGIVRQYSIVSAPGDVNCSSQRGFPGIVLGVKREPNSRGGSVSVHEEINVGNTLEVSRPKNHFRIANNRSALFLAGGIGVTPLLSMAHHMEVANRGYALHYFVRSAQHTAFRDRLKMLSSYNIHPGLSPSETEAQLTSLLTSINTETDVYVCGPKPFLEAVMRHAEQVGVAADRIHFELFSNPISHENDKPFRVRLARSGEELEVAVGQPLSDVLIDHGCPVETSCEQGVCGTCMVTVLEGQPEHRDVYLSADEKQAGRCMQTCVSRSQSDVLVLDL